jgi:hypothetical protein
MTTESKATLAQISMLFTFLTLAGAACTGCTALLSYAISVWVMLFLVFFLVVWLALENWVLLKDLKTASIPSENARQLHLLQSETISAMAMEARSLREKNTALAETLKHVNQCSIALLHWELLYRKVVVMHYIMHFQMNKAVLKMRQAHISSAKKSIRLSQSLNDIPESEFRRQPSNSF